MYADGDPDHYRNLITSSLAHCQPSLKISCKSVWKFLCKVANGQTNDKNICSFAEVTMTTFTLCVILHMSTPLCTALVVKHSPLHSYDMKQCYILDCERELYIVSQKTSHLWLVITLTHMNRF